MNSVKINKIKIKSLTPESLNKFSRLSHSNAKEKGFYDVPFNLGEKVMLIISELSEAIEAHRSGKFANLTKTTLEDLINLNDPKAYNEAFEFKIKNTFEDEIADAFIRIVDLAGYFQVEFNSRDIITSMNSLTYTKNVGERILIACKEVSKLHEKMSTDKRRKENFLKIIGTLSYLAYDGGFNLYLHIELKMKFNSLRGRLHGKNY